MEELGLHIEGFVHIVLGVLHIGAVLHTEDSVHTAPEVLHIAVVHIAVVGILVVVVGMLQ